MTAVHGLDITTEDGQPVAVVSWPDDDEPLLEHARRALAALGVPTGRYYLSSGDGPATPDHLDYVDEEPPDRPERAPLYPDNTGAECRAARSDGHGCLGRVLDGQCTEQDDHHPTPGMVPCCGPGEHDGPPAAPADDTAPPDDPTFPTGSLVRVIRGPWGADATEWDGLVGVVHSFTYDIVNVLLPGSRGVRPFPRTDLQPVAADDTAAPDPERAALDRIAEIVGWPPGTDPDTVVAYVAKRDGTAQMLQGTVRRREQQLRDAVAAGPDVRYPELIRMVEAAGQSVRGSQDGGDPR